MTAIESRLTPFKANPYHASSRAANEPLLRAISYRPRVHIVPDRQAVNIAASGMYEGRVSVPPGAALWAIAGSSQRAEGFKLNLIDGGNGSPIATEAPYFSQLTGNATTQVKDCSGTLRTITNPLYILPRYRLVTEPGLIRVQIANLSTSANQIQVALYFSLPPRPGDRRNEWNELVDAELDLARRAIRNLDLMSGQPIAAAPPSQAVTLGGDPMRQPATPMPFNITGTGDTVVIPAAAGYRIAIHQLSIWSPIQQTIRFLAGTPSGTDLQGPLTDFSGGDFMPYVAEEPHFVLPSNVPFVINNAAGTAGTTGPVTGLVKYRMLQKWGA